jgi:hypothetical protein
MRLTILAVLLCMAGCATPVEYGTQPKATLDRDTRYTVDERPDGFTASVSYDRYQFIPETAAVMAACKSALMALAYDVADRRGRKIEPLNEQRIRISTGRNGLTGITSCEASVPAVWKP